MRFSHFFIDRPIFATVLSTLILVVGGIAYFNLPVAQYPNVALPTVVVRANYPGASPETIADTVATPLEQEINGVEDMLYMESQSTLNGALEITITFEQGADLDQAQVLVQNRVAIAEPRLPDTVQQLGVTTRKSSPDLLMVVHLFSPDKSRDPLYISNYAFLRIRDVLSRQPGVGDVQVFGAREYSMRIWLDMERASALGLTAGEVVQSLRAQNIQVAAGLIGQPPLKEPQALQIPVNTKGRLRDAEEFAKIVVKSGEDGRLVRIRDIGRVELGARDYSVNSYLDGKDAVAIAVFQRPGSNAIETAQSVLAEMERLKQRFPPGLASEAVYNPTEFIDESIDQVFETLFLASLLVVLTIFVFLQSWRATIIPIVAIPVSLVGTFALLFALGFSLNSLSLFGLVLAIGIVVDDAIVVVENVERLLSEGLAPRDAARQAMNEVGSALIATSLVLIAVFVPTSFLTGISGQFYRQFAVTISVSTALSTLVSLTLSPAMCALLLKPKQEDETASNWLWNRTLGWFFSLFNRAFAWSNERYTRFVGRIVRAGGIALAVYVGLIGLTGLGFTLVPGGFIPLQDQGYLVVSVQLPEGASLYRTDETTLQATEIALDTPGVIHAVAFAGFSGATRTNSPKAGAIFVTLDDFSTRVDKGLSMPVILRDLRKRLAQIRDGRVVVIPPPPVRGVGTGGGFKMQLQDKGNVGYVKLRKAAETLVAQANQEPGLVQVFSTFRAETPQIYVDVNRTKVQMLQIPQENVSTTLQVYLGSIFVNDFNYLGRTYQVTAQAEPQFRDEETDIARLRTRSRTGAIVPLGSVAEIERRVGPDRVVRYNLFPAADINGDTTPNFSSGQAISLMERLAEEHLPPGVGYEWTDTAFQQKRAADTAIYIFPLCVLFAFLALAALYESWLLPLAVILIVPMCLLSAIVGVGIRGMDNNLLTQIGFVVLAGLACKNAILLVEFAKAEEDQGKSRFEAAVEACRLRLRPILMTAFSFILGVVPLVIATGAGAEMRRALGTAVFSGMLGVTFFGLIFTPVFYVVLRSLAKSSRTA